MLVKCIINKCENPKLIVFENDNEIENFHNFYNLDDKYGEYAVEINETYRVFSIALIDGEIYYLLLDRNNNLQFYPANIFEISNGDLDALNYINYYKNEFIQYLIYFEELKDIKVIKKIIAKDIEEINKFYNKIKKIF